MPTVGSWCELDVICSAITALIQWTSPCVGFWLCTPPTGIVPINAIAKREFKLLSKKVKPTTTAAAAKQSFNLIELFWDNVWKMTVNVCFFCFLLFVRLFVIILFIYLTVAIHSRFTVDDADVVVVTIAVRLSSFPICVELPLCGCGLVIWLFPLFTELLLLFVSELLLLSPFRLFSVTLQGNDGAADFYFYTIQRRKEKSNDISLANPLILNWLRFRKWKKIINFSNETRKQTNKTYHFCTLFNALNNPKWNWCL